MPIRSDIRRILLLGSGPIRIGQAAEFDFSGSQACRALRDCGYEVILVNSNPATIQSDPMMADRVYIEPIIPEVVERVIERERPDALLAGMGGQTALNITTELAHSGVLERYGVELIGSDVEAIERAEDRKLFEELCRKEGLPVPEAIACTTVSEVLAAATKIGRWPLLVRPAYTLGGLGGGTVYNENELVEIARQGIRHSRIDQVLIEESLLGWQEFEYEVMRDSANNAIIVCTMENLDPMGVHTGESIVVAPHQTLSDRDHQELRDAALQLIRALRICGGCNVQFTVNPSTGDWRVIEVNPRVSRSSALASKATGYPIARIAALIAVGQTLDEIPNPIVGGRTTAAFEPTLDYCVVKIPRWPFDKFRTVDRQLGTSMKSTGEVMAIGRCFEEALLKAWASLETKHRHPRPLTLADLGDGEGQIKGAQTPLDPDTLSDWIQIPTDRRLGALIECFRREWTIEAVEEATGIVPWFLHRLSRIAMIEGELSEGGWDPNTLPLNLLEKAKRAGFTDAAVADALAGFPARDPTRLRLNESAIRTRRWDAGLHPTFRMVDSCAAEFEAATPYDYSTYEGSTNRKMSDDGALQRPVIVLGGGPIRIGQGIEFDYSCVHAVEQVRASGRSAIIVNNNPETVSTDFDVSDRLYFEPLTLEHVLEVIVREGGGDVVAQFGGQTAIDIAVRLSKSIPDLEHRGHLTNILGTPVESIEAASDRDLWCGFAEREGLPIPASAIASSPDQLREEAGNLGFPLLVRPSFVLGGRGMEILEDDDQLAAYLTEAWLDAERPLLVDAFLEGAMELDVDAVCDGKNVIVGAIMEHLEEVGIHSGDSTCFMPPQNLSSSTLLEVEELTRRIGSSLRIIGAYNIQYAILDGRPVIIEVNPRASRTVPYVAKASGRPLARLAMDAMLGGKFSVLGAPQMDVCAVKSPVFPFLKLRGLDPAPGPEMKSTGEVMGIDPIPAVAYLKARLATELPVPKSGGVYLTVRDESKSEIISIAENLVEMGFTLHATRGTAWALREAGVSVSIVHRIAERRAPDALDLMRRGEVQLIVNVPERKGGARLDGDMMRRLAVDLGIPFHTTISGASQEVAAIHSYRQNGLPEPVCLQDV